MAGRLQKRPRNSGLHCVAAVIGRVFAAAAGATIAIRLSNELPLDAALLFLHLLAFVYWVGADIAVFYGAGFAADPRLSAEARAAIGRLTGWVDQFPRSAVPVVGATGATVAQRGFLDLSNGLLIAVWLVAAVWIFVNLRLYALGARSEQGRPWGRFDLGFRALIGVLLAGAAVGSLAGFGLNAPPWLALKLLLFAASIGFAMAVRILFRPFRPALARVESGASNPDDQVVMARSLFRTRLAVVGIWLCAGAAAFLGLWQPG